MVGGLEVTRANGSQTMIEATELSSFQASLSGKVLRDSDAGYDDARKVWNGMIDKRPALIARCAGVADVMDAVNFARTNNLLVSVRGGGHNITGNAVCDGGLMIDLSPMKGLRVDPISTHRPRPGGPHLGRVQPRDASLWPSQHWWGHLDDGHRRIDVGWRPRLAHGKARPQLRQSAFRRHRHG